MGNKAPKMGGKSSDSSLSEKGKPASDPRKVMSPGPKANAPSPQDKNAPPPPPKKTSAPVEKRDAPAPPAPPDEVSGASAETADFSDYKLNTKLTIDDFELLKVSKTLSSSIRLTSPVGSWERLIW